MKLIITEHTVQSMTQLNYPGNNSGKESRCTDPQLQQSCMQKYSYVYMELNVHVTLVTRDENSNRKFY